MQFIDIHFSYFLPYIIPTLVLSVILTILMIKISPIINYIDYPNERKMHKKPIPYGGGIAIYLSFLIILILNWENIFGNKSFYELKEIYGILIGSLIILIIGFLADKYDINKKLRIFLQFIAITIVILSGVGISFISLPFGNTLNLDIIKIPFQIGQDLYHISVISDIFTIIWFFVIINSMNLIDGVDGLSGGIGFIGFFTIFLLSITSKVNQIDTATIAIIMAFAILGFLFFNFYKAKIYMGDAGAMFIGYMIASLSIISGSKVATAFLIVGIPILDFIISIIRRFLNKQSIFTPDKKHIHHILIESGFSPLQTTIILNFLCLIFAFIALYTETIGKLIAILLLVFIITTIYILLNKLKYKNEKK